MDGVAFPASPPSLAWTVITLKVELVVFIRHMACLSSQQCNLNVCPVDLKLRYSYPPLCARMNQNLALEEEYSPSREGWPHLQVLDGG